MREKYLLGATEDNGIVFGEFEITTRNGYPEFTASFDEVNPFTEDELEDGEDYYEELLDSCYDDEQKYKLCEQYNCKPSELAECMADECGTEPMDIRDCSLYPEIIDVDGVDYYFESGSCGQHDTRGNMKEYVNEDAYNLIHKLWDKYHLKNVSNVGEDVTAIVDKLSKELSKVDEEEWIREYIRNNF